MTTKMATKTTAAAAAAAAAAAGGEAAREEKTRDRATALPSNKNEIKNNNNNNDQGKSSTSSMENIMNDLTEVIKFVGSLQQEAETSYKKDDTRGVLKKLALIMLHLLEEEDGESHTFAYVKLHKAWKNGNCQRNIVEQIGKGMENARIFDRIEIFLNNCEFIKKPSISDQTTEKAVSNNRGDVDVDVDGEEEKRITQENLDKFDDDDTDKDDDDADDDDDGEEEDHRQQQPLELNLSDNKCSVGNKILAAMEKKLYKLAQSMAMDPKTITSISTAIDDRKGILLLSFHDLFHLVNSSFTGRLSFRAEGTSGYEAVMDRADKIHKKNYDPDREIRLVISVCCGVVYFIRGWIFPKQYSLPTVCRSRDMVSFNCVERSSSNRFKAKAPNKCLVCGDKTIMVCSACEAPYCRKECQREAWSTHKPECLYVRSLKQEVEEME